MEQILSPVNTEGRAKLGIRSGDTVRVQIKVEERGKTRLQSFEGLVLSVKHGTEAGAMFTVRTTLSGVGVEKAFPLYSPTIDSIEIIKRSKVRRSKLYFIRDKAAKAVRRQLRNARIMNVKSEEELPEEETEVPEDAPDKETADVATQETQSEVTTEEKKEPVA